MRRASLARWLVVGALAAMGLLFGAASAVADDGSNVQGQNSSGGAAGASGNVQATNELSFNGGASAASTGGDSAQASQAGDNSGSVNQGAQASSADAAAGSQVTGCVGPCTVQNQNSSTAAVAVSGPAAASNVAVATMGPSAESTGGPAQSFQAGGNRLSIDQWSAASSGDAVAGSQVTGVVYGGTVQNQNRSQAVLAVSGPACASFVCGAGNLLFAALGPASFSDGPQAQAAQVGRNDAVLTQGAEARSGDGVAGSQVTGIVDGYGAAVQNQNTASFALGFSGPAVAGNLTTVNLGSAAFAATSGTGGGTAQAGQTGNNAVVSSQQSHAASGDAVASSQVTGLAAVERGHLKVQNQQSSEADAAISGIAVAFNASNASAGAAAFAGSVDGDANAQAGQFGNNVVSMDQTATAQTGDAVSSSQVTGVVGALSGSIALQGSSTAALAVSGPAVSANVAGAIAGPEASASQSAFNDGVSGNATAQVNQAGNSVAAVHQASDATSGDAVAASQVTGAAGHGILGSVSGQLSAQGHLALSGAAVSVNVADAQAGPLANAQTSADGQDAVAGAADAQSAQAGHSVVNVAQAGSSVSGDAVSGSQVAGIVSTGTGASTIANQASSTAGVAVSGIAVSVNAASAVAGPQALALSAAVANESAIGVGAEAIASATAGDADAQSSQLGSDTASVIQVGGSVTGDAVSGSQVTGAVLGASRADIANQLSSTATLAASGPAASINTAGAVSGPIADAASIASATAVAECDDCTAIAVSSAADATSGALQGGDNHILASQDTAAVSGDALAGSQVTGVSAQLAHVTVQDQLRAQGALALSGPAVAASAADAQAGPAALSATIADSTAAALCDDCTAIALGIAPFATDAHSSQLGHNGVVAAQTVEAATGDAVAGSQVAGIVANASVVSVSRQSVANLSAAIGGPAFAQASTDVAAQPYAEATTVAAATAVPVAGTTVAVGIGGDAGAVAAQQGSNNLGSTQVLRADGGDVVAGSQIAGVVANGGSATIHEQLSSSASLAVGGAAVATAATQVAGGPFAVADASAVALGFLDAGALLVAVGGQADAQASQIGSNGLDSIQVVFADTGDAVAGSQVTGAVVTLGTVTVTNQSRSGLAVSIGGSAVAAAESVVFGGPSSLADASAQASSLLGAGVAGIAVAGDAQAQTQQAGHNHVESVQAAQSWTGDAVAGSQVTGAVAQAGSAVVSAQSDSTLSVAVAGSAQTFAGSFLAAGPNAEASATASANLVMSTLAAVLAVGADAEAQAFQLGSNVAEVFQATEAMTGDAVSGSQVTGIVAVGTSAVAAIQNVSAASLAISGGASAANTAAATLGPDAFGLSGAFGFVAGGVATVVITTGADAQAQASQAGGNLFLLDQDAVSSSGDAVSGSQVSGLLQGRVQGQNLSALSAALTGSVDSANNAVGGLGPAAVSFDGSAASAHAGRSVLDALQQVRADSGDSVVGSQVTGTA